MGQEQNNSQPPAAAPNQNKRHYREIGGPVQADPASQGNQKAVAKSGGNRPPRNNQRPSANGQPQSAGGPGQRQQRRPKNRRPASQQAGKQGPVERFDHGRQNERNNANINKPGLAADQQNDTARQTIDAKSLKAEPVKVNEAVRQPRQDRNIRQDQQRNDQTRSAGQNNRQPARWEKKVRTEETFDDVRRDNERIEKEIWLEIAGIHTIKLDF